MRLGGLVKDLPELPGADLSGAPSFVEKLGSRLANDPAEALLSHSRRASFLVQGDHDRSREKGRLECRRVGKEIRSGVSLHLVRAGPDSSITIRASLTGNTHDSNTPKEAHRGIRPSGRGYVFSASHTVWKAVSSYLALGSRATVSFTVQNMRPISSGRAGLSLLTIPQRSHDSEHGSVIRVPVVVDAHDVDVDHPRGLAGGDDERFGGKRPRPAVSRASALQLTKRACRSASCSSSAPRRRADRA